MPDKKSATVHTNVRQSKQVIVLEMASRNAQLDSREGIRQGLEDARKGRGRPAEAFFREFEARHGVYR